ncbi:DUF6058 family natural product biosynthesis protein [Undibacterium sp.]|uniref:DUF6058 family natural product biosynthesis protein n=1 Tax=Undibacterium sp. TaxID=1914977 RepID=UPI002C53D131|nr:DUF6058 family natural product biosynthesis protein [Undibacterium sp.]HTD05331.1 DUF6058 family natural product biosynthesis protein [Undibacterium sp.]
MSLLDYLNANFYTTSQLLAKSGIDAGTLHAWENAGCMPMPSYRLEMQLHCQSFFCGHDETQQLDFYARDYVEWLGFLHTLSPSASLVRQAYTAFHERYSAQALKLFLQGIQPARFKAQAGGADLAALDAHIGEEWLSFLKGTYGLCTRSGLPEDIANKEMATLAIDEITDRQRKEALTTAESVDLIKAMRLLDQASSMFAPHERAGSSRQRCIAAAAEKYNLAL